MISAQDKLLNQTKLGKHICVGLDPDLNRIPKHLLNLENPIWEFNKIIIDSTVDLAVSYKLNFAFYECLGLKGIETLYKTVEYIPDDILIIADAKRGDIGNTSQKYASAIFDDIKCDAVTLHPYMGIDSISPFTNYTDKLSFILGLTSNKSSEDFEKLRLNDGQYLFQNVLNKISAWNVNNNLGVVFGATNNRELQTNLNFIKDIPVLLPGVGAQGGDPEFIKKLFLNCGKTDYIVNVSRGLLYVDQELNFEKKVKQEMVKLHNIFSE